MKQDFISFGWRSDEEAFYIVRCSTPELRDTKVIDLGSHGWHIIEFGFAYQPDDEDNDVVVKHNTALIQKDEPDTYNG